MTAKLDLFWSFRSPYSYLALPRLIAIERDWPVEIRARPVRPLALRQPDFFEREQPGWMHYLLTDVMRQADYLGMTIALPNPDPVIMEPDRPRALPDQPHIDRLTRIGVVAEETGHGLAALYALSTHIWSGQRWTDEGVVESALTEAGLDADTVLLAAESDTERLDRAIADNEAALAEAGHWGVPTMVYKGEPFFGQDRIDVLLWRLKQDGLQPRRKTG